MRYLIYFSILLFFIPFVGFSQEEKLKQAEHLYEKHNYIDAQKVYLRVIDKGYKSAQVYGSLADSYYYQSKYKEAAFWYKRMFDEFKNDVTAAQYIRGIQSYRSTGRIEDAEILMEEYTDKFGDSSIFRNYNADQGYLKTISIANPKVEIVEQEVNKSGSNHSPAFLGEDKIVYASESIEMNRNMNTWDGAGFLDLFIAERNPKDGQLSNTHPIKGDVNSSLHESAATFTKDGKTMYFTRNNIRKGKRGKDSQDLIRLKIYKAELEDNGTWIVVDELPFNDNSFSTAYPALNSEENKLYFSSDREGSLGMSDIWFVDIYRNGTYGAPIHLGSNINTELREAFLFIDSEDRLYFASDGHTGLGGLDIFSTQLDSEGMPGEIDNMGAPFNTPYDDFAFIIELEGERGYFTSNRKEKGGVNDKIYSFQYECFVELQGYVEDIGMGTMIPGGEVRLYNENQILLSKTKVNEDGSYRFELACETVYGIQASAKGYDMKEYRLYTPARTGGLLLDIDLDIEGACDSDDLGCRLGLQPIYFDFDMSDIRPDAEIELAKILEALMMYPELNIHIESHTDSRGNDAYNLSLSERRAQATRDWLINNGMQASRLTAKGYGETQLKNDCTNTADCSEEEHALNRRSMFLIKN